MALSILLVLCGILMAVAAQMFDSAKLNEEFKPARDNRKLAVRTLVAVTATLFVTGFWGIATYKLKNKMFVSVFGLATLAMAVILSACAAIFNALANLSDEQMNAVCPLSTSASGTTDSNAVITSFEPLEDVEVAVKEIDSLNELSSYYMCSPTCPCLKPADSTINGWTDE